MGCAFSRDINKTHPNIFLVQNFDDRGGVGGEANLEVTEASLVLHQRGRISLTWPLKCLRRYGAEGNVFSFESGRKCTTGAGIYAFRCQKADILLSMVQDRIRSGSNNNPTEQQQGVQRTPSQEQQQQQQTPQQLPPRIFPNGDNSLNEMRNNPEPPYVNVSFTSPNDRFDGYLVPNYPPPPAALAAAVAEQQQQQQQPQTEKKDEETVAVTTEINYIAVEFESNPPLTPTKVSPSCDPLPPPQSPTTPTAATAPSSQPPESPSTTTSPQYCTIDVGRTQALSTTAKQRSSATENGKKTRHNSMMSELSINGKLPLKRNSSGNE